MPDPAPLTPDELAAIRESLNDAPPGLGLYEFGRELLRTMHDATKKREQTARLLAEVERLRALLGEE